MEEIIRNFRFGDRSLRIGRTSIWVCRFVCVVLLKKRSRNDLRLVSKLKDGDVGNLLGLMSRLG